MIWWHINVLWLIEPGFQDTDGLIRGIAYVRCIFVLRQELTAPKRAHRMFIFFHCHPFWMGGTSQVDSKKGLKMRHFYIYLRGSMFFMGGRNQLRRATSSVGLHFGLGSLVQHLVFPMGWGFAMSKLHMADVSRFYLGHITYISPTTGFVDVWGRCMIWWLSILDGCDKPSWPLLLFDVDAFFCCLQGDYWENAQLQETIETPSSGWDGCHMFYSCALINAWVSAMLDH